MHNEMCRLFHRELMMTATTILPIGGGGGGEGGYKSFNVSLRILEVSEVCAKECAEAFFYTCLQTVFIKFSKCISQVMSGISIIFCKKLQSRGSLRSMRCVQRNVQGQRGLFVPLASGSIGREAALLAQQWVFAVNTSVQKVFAENTMCRNAREMYSLADSLLVKDGREVLAITSYD